MNTKVSIFNVLPKVLHLIQTFLYTFYYYYRKFTIVNPGGRGAKRNFSQGVKPKKEGVMGGIFAPGVKRNFFDFVPGIQYIFDKLIVMDTSCFIFYTSLVKM